VTSLSRALLAHRVGRTAGVLTLVAGVAAASWLAADWSDRAPRTPPGSARPGPTLPDSTPDPSGPPPGTHPPHPPTATAYPGPTGAFQPDPTDPAGIYPPAATSDPTRPAPGNAPPGPGVPGEPTTWPIPSPGPDTPDGTAPDDLLDRTDPPPDGVPAQLDVFLGGTQCPPDNEPGPPAVIMSLDFSIPARVVPCFMNFDRSQLLTVTLTRPDGVAEPKVLPAIDPTMDFSVSFMLRPGWPTGSYQLAARQTDREVVTTLTVRLATEPMIWVEEISRTAGEDVNLYLGGYPPGGPATVYVYGARRGEIQSYRTSFLVPIDHRGEGQMIIHTRPDQADRCYSLTGLPGGDPPRASPSGQFCLT